MKKLLLFFIPLLLLSCSEDNFETEKVYEFNKMRWIKEAGDGESFEELVMPEVVYKNTGTTVMTIVSSTEDYVKDTSTFTSNDPLAFILECDNMPSTVNVPRFDSDIQGYFYASGLQVPYEEGDVIVPPKLVVTDTVHLEPGTKITYNTTVTVQKLTFTYEIVLQETTTSEELIIKGKWYGYFYYTSESYSEIEEITLDK